MRQILKRGKAKRDRYAVFACRRGGQPVLVSRRDYPTKALAQGKAARLKKALVGIEDDAFRPLIIKIVKQRD